MVSFEKVGPTLSFDPRKIFLFGPIFVSAAAKIQGNVKTYRVNLSAYTIFYVLCNIKNFLLSSVHCFSYTQGTLESNKTIMLHYIAGWYSSCIKLLVAKVSSRKMVVIPILGDKQ